MFETIVVGTDGSESAGVAVHRAIELAALTGATLHIAHAYRPVSAAHMGAAASVGAPTFDPESLNQGMVVQSTELCRRVAQQARASDVTCEMHPVPGDPSEVLVDLAEHLKADLLIVGNRGMTGVRRFMLGSVPNKVAHHAPCSVHIVDTGEK